MVTQGGDAEKSHRGTLRLQSALTLAPSVQLQLDRIKPMIKSTRLLQHQ